MRMANVKLLLRTLQLRGASSMDPGSWTPAVMQSLLPLLHQQGADLWLFRRLEDLGLLADEERARVVRPLARALSLRWMRIDEQTEAVIRVLSGLGIPFRLIKGVARRAAAQRYPYADAKSSSDVDVLVPEEAAETAWQGLLRHGCEVAASPDGPRTHPLHFHLPPIWDARRVAVEIHFSTDRWVPPAEAWRRATVAADRVSWCGHELEIPSATELLWHGLTHAFKSGPAAGYRLRAFLDAASIMASAPIRWEVIRGRIHSGEVREQRWGETSISAPAEVVGRWLGGAARLAGVELPAELRPAGSLSLEHLVRWRGLFDKVEPWTIQERLLDEGIRREGGWDPAATDPERSGYLRARHRALTRVIRLSYSAWRGVLSPI